MIGTCVYRGEVCTIIDVLVSPGGASEYLIHWGIPLWIDSREVTRVKWIPQMATNNAKEA